MDIKQIVTIDNDILNGQPVFSGTRVPIESLFVWKLGFRWMSS